MVQHWESLTDLAWYSLPGIVQFATNKNSASVSMLPGGTGITFCWVIIQKCLIDSVYFKRRCDIIRFGIFPSWRQNPRLACWIIHHTESNAIVNIIYIIVLSYTARLASSAFLAIVTYAVFTITAVTKPCIAILITTHR